MSPAKPYAVVTPLPARKAAPTLEATRYFPRAGRAAPPHLQPVPTPPPDEATACIRLTGRVAWKDILSLRGEVPAPKSTRKAAPFIPPYLQSGYRWDQLGVDLHAQMARDAGKAAAIRSVPKNLAALLKTAEWKGARVVGTVASPEIGAAERELAASQGRVNEAERRVAELQERLSAPDLGDKVAHTLNVHLKGAQIEMTHRLQSLHDSRQRLEVVLSEQWILVVHPSGAEVRIRPQWGKD